MYDMVKQKKRKKRKVKRISMRPTPTDKKHIKQIKSRTGVLTTSDAIRIGLKKAARG